MFFSKTQERQFIEQAMKSTKVSVTRVEMGKGSNIDWSNFVKDPMTKNHINKS